MRFLIDANMPRGSVDVLRLHGHDAVHVRDVLSSGADDGAVADYALANALCLVTRDLDFADTERYPPSRFAGIVVMRCQEHATVRQILEQLAALLQQTEAVQQLAGRLAICEPARVRIRPPIDF